MLLLLINNVQFSRNLTVNGMFWISNKGELSLDSNISINSGSNYNRIGGDIKTNIIVSKNAKYKIGNNISISNSTIFCQNSITIEDNVLIGGGTKIYDSDLHSIDFDDRLLFFKNNQIERKANSKGIYIKNGAWIGGHCIILKSVTIGKKSVVGAGSVVVKSIPDNEIRAENFVLKKII